MVILFTKKWFVFLTLLGVIFFINPPIAYSIELLSSKTTHPPYSNIFDELSAKFELEVDESKIKPHLIWLDNNHDYFIRVANRSAQYIYFVKEELKKNGLPIDIALLPWVESAYYPFAFSPSRASGIWQFTPYTGKIYGLRQNYWYDGRRDIYDSTRAAITFLKYLHRKFDGDWLLALAAYNSGEGRVSRAIKKNKRNNRPTDFFSLQLPNETKGYVPRLLAIAHMIKNREKYQLELPFIENTPVLEVINMNEQVDISLLARLTNLSIEEIYNLNPGFNRWATEPNVEYKLMIPVEKVSLFKQAFENYPKNQLINWVRHEIKKGDSLSEIAYQYRTNIALIKRINGIEGDTLIADQHVIIPVAKRPTEEYVLSQAMQQKIRFSRIEEGIKVIHHVKKDESLWSIAEKYDIRLSDLIRWNNLSRRSILQINQKLVLWHEPDRIKTQVIENAIKENQYMVNAGDTLSQISKQYQVSTRDLAMVNNISEFNSIQAGDILTIPNDDFIEPIVEYTVQKNDTIGKIAKQYNLSVEEIINLNLLDDENKIVVGQKLKLFGFLPANAVDEGALPAPDKRAVIREIRYLVRKGDSLAKIATKFKVQISDILKWNKDIKDISIFPQQELILYIDLTNF